MTFAIERTWLGIEFHVCTQLAGLKYVESHLVFVHIILFVFFLQAADKLAEIIVPMKSKYLEIIFVVKWPTAFHVFIQRGDLDSKPTSQGNDRLSSKSDQSANRVALMLISFAVVYNCEELLDLLLWFLQAAWSSHFLLQLHCNRPHTSRLFTCDENGLVLEITKDKDRLKKPSIESWQAWWVGWNLSDPAAALRQTDWKSARNEGEWTPLKN